MHIAEISYHVLHVSAKTNWSFVRLRMDNGLTGWGECSLNGWEPLQRAFADRWWPSLIGRSVIGVDDTAALCTIHLHASGGLVVHSIKSATEQALLDVLAQARGVPLWQLLGGARRSEVAVYANINRATQPRTPQGFAASARLAVQQGYGAVKLAPFDGVLPATAESDAGAQRIAAALECIRAVRDAVGSDIRVMVDCHWRLTPRTARDVLDALREVRLHWLECPISERGSLHDEILALRRHANAQDVHLAGAEKETEVEGFRPYLTRGLYDTIMPDVKYCGGVAALVRIAEVAARHGVQTAPHNPTGPICNFASVHACMVGAGCDFLELQVSESDLFTSSVGGSTPAFTRGNYLQPQAAGLGAAVDTRILDAHPFAAVAEGLDPSLG